MGKTKFQNSWQRDRPWLVTFKDVYEAQFRICGGSEYNTWYWSY